MTSSHPRPISCQWFSRLGVGLARGRRTVAGWIRAAKLGDEFQSSYTAAASEGEGSKKSFRRMSAESRFVRRYVGRLIPSDLFCLTEHATMAKYLLIYRSPAEMVPPSPEEMQAFLGMWGAWYGKFGAAIADGGDGLHHTGKMIQKGGLVTDGPYVESKEVIGGYSVIVADDYDKALAISKECPIALAGGSIEIREFAGYNS